MAAPKTPIWPAEPHTLAKHAILKRYLHAWFPILASGHGRVFYCDGFAGPGRYSGGEEGSPIIALEAAKAHATRLTSEVVFLFIEKDATRAAHLRDVEIPAIELPKTFKHTVWHDEFSTAFRRLLDSVDEQKKAIAPTFAFIDPFGIDVPFDLVARLLKKEGCEVLITFMKGAVNRFVTELGPQTNALIGDDAAVGILTTAPDRLLAARQLYQRSLSKVARFIRYFEMRDNKGVPIYDLFFATNHRLGHLKMKEAMWAVDDEGTFAFADKTDPLQSVLFSDPHGNHLARTLLREFGPRLTEWAQTSEIKRFVEDHTEYIQRHFTEAMRLLEEGGVSGDFRLEVAQSKLDGKPRKKKTFPDGTLVRFVRTTA